MDIPISVFMTKALSVCSIFGFSVLFGTAPLFCKRCVKSKKVQWINNGIISFSGGTLLGISFLHLMPETRSSVARLLNKGHFSSFPVHVSLADTVICGGFFFIYVFDELIHLLLQWAGADHYHQPHGLREADHEAFNFVQGAEIPKGKERKQTKEHVDDVLFLFLSIATHKYAIAFSVSLDLLLSGVKDNMILIYTICFSIVNPLGICIGIASDVISREEKIESPMTVLMQGLASGSLIYVTCFEVLQRHTSSDDHISGIRNTMFVILGFIFILVMKIYLPHDHSFYEVQEGCG